MGTISEKLTYLNVTKQKLKQAINNIGGEVTDETTFREYVNQLENAYDRLPKTEFEEGENVTLENTLKGKLDFDDGKVGFGQASQDSRQGYNLLQANLPTTTDSGITITNNNDGTFTINGTNTSASLVTFRLDDPNLQDYEDGTYTLDKGTTNTDIFIRLMQNGTWTQIITVSYEERLKSQAITNATNTFIYIGIKGNATINNVTIKPMFVKGSYTESTMPSFEQYGASPSPSYPQTINSVTGNQDVVVKDGNNNTIATYQLSLGDIELNAIGNYKDELIYDVDEDKVYKNEKIGKFNVDSTSWQYIQVTQGSLFRSALVGTGIITNSTCVCTHYTCLTQSTRTNPCTYINVDNPIIDVIDSRFQATSQGLSDFKAWCRTNNVTWYIPLRNATLTEIIDTNLHNQVKMLYNAQSLNGTTIVTSSGNLPMIIKIRALKGSS